jgi:ubiquinone biosynthesis protein
MTDLIIEEKRQNRLLALIAILLAGLLLWQMIH